MDNPQYWVKYWIANHRVGLREKCRLFHNRNNAIDFANTLYQRDLISYEIPGY